MSLADYLGPIILLSLLGLAIVGGTIAWVTYYLMPKAAELRTERDEHAASLVKTKLAIEFDRGARELVNDLIAFENQIPAELMDKVWELDKLNSSTSTTERKRLSR